MTKKEYQRISAMMAALGNAGISGEDGEKLRRISMTLHRWAEWECGDGNSCVERDDKTGKPYVRFVGGRCYPIPDRETGALKRLQRIMSQYPHLSHYVQGDPRGCALYILRPGDVPEGKEADNYYDRGIAIY